MGIYDRDYERPGNDWRGGGGERWRGEPGGVQLRWPQTWVYRLILINIVAYIVQLIGATSFSPYFYLEPDWYRRPWQAYQLLTYGFMHDTDGPGHLFWNMFGLWMFGRDVENKYGRREFITFYLAAIVFGGLMWTAAGVPNGSVGGPALGASGAVVAVTLLYALNWPERQILLFLVLPVPMWLLAAVMIIGDLSGAFGMGGTQVAYMIHLTGAALALAYYFGGLRLGEYLPGSFKMPKLSRGPKLRVRTIDDLDQEDADETRENAILKKIHDSGQDSLTRAERKFLEQRSRKARERRGEF
ncbi:Rhomboid family protein [Pirellulimonas nuda]|uniref:Rhomboid family protein n=1 Tax=Pirellulimonas nuda TaxID=2528009 RepID=A0A518D5J6_9BACT|nr:rhomboid family intramembrane serine protease [Pirellulimonas nuda]QDU86740.1 Rhomboid family protein [Pirellulimonas nuda]